MKTTVQNETPKAATAEVQRQNYVTPEVNIFETKDGYIVEAEMPGVGKGGLNITVEANELTLVGHRTEPPFNGEVLFQESKHADYRRVFEIDPAIDTARVTARIDQGVVTVTLPKSEAVKPRKISVE
jgi:Molecular chaperone (small heat shock protein)